MAVSVERIGNLAGSSQQAGEKAPQHVLVVDEAGDPVSFTGGVGGATQYTEGDTDATITGTAVMFEDASNTIRPASESTPLPVRATGYATGGHLTFRSLDLDETEEEVKGTAGTIYGIIFTNTSSSTRWLKLYNATAASVSVGTTTPLLTIGLPGTAGGSDITGSIPIPQGGIAFTTAICAAATTGIADADTGAPGANEVSVNILYR